jgi:hypothetical protein
MLGLISWQIMSVPKIEGRMIITERYSVRRLDLHSPEPRMEREAASDSLYPGPWPRAKTQSDDKKPAAPAPVPRQIAQRTPAPRTLVQPDIPPNLLPLQETPIPAVLLWSAQKLPTKRIALPRPHEATAADVRPSLDSPNEEANLADLAISSSDSATATQALSPSTTSPVVINNPELKQQVPETTSQTADQPTPAAAMSLSDLHMPAGAAVLPPANQTAPAPAPAGATLASKLSGSSRQEGNGGPDGKKSENGAGRNSDDSGKKAAPTSGVGTQNAAKAVPAQVAGTGSNSVKAPSAEHITLPKNGQFGAVVVGSSMEEEYPETAGLWNSRLAYTVYLHVGLKKNWILQYSLPRSDDAATAGNIARIGAPWPYNIVRPNLSADEVNADALMIHGFLNEAGRFEALAVVFPPKFAQEQFLLDSLKQWQFRPATQNGRDTRVEVLLIIPEEPE